ncbi:hypothetical protein EJV47_18255 [Hymenobacter gummosus]|uniref:Zinc-ribbon domain-containing protein n=1 Tax=Hymenobacter gummosus TaxID=1776032 RepID=A0A431U053_9BACT|nr:hypothetical protein [Hymenobacter gummosus]RTQ47862.1 hypothetical protein EJV47_18255 [Hymenobacter gummosus]
MKLFGHRSSRLLSAAAATRCEACGAPAALHLSVLGRYVHAFGLPLVAVGKTAAGQCLACRREFRAPELPAPLQPTLAALAPRAKEPLWHSAGALLAGLVALGIWGGGVWQHYRSETLLHHPHVGDLYHIRSEAPGYYTLLKVEEVHGNSLRLRQNNYETDIEAELPQLDQPKNYAAEPFDLTQLDLQIMQVQHELVAVERPGKK